MNCELQTENIKTGLLWMRDKKIKNSLQSAFLLKLFVQGPGLELIKVENVKKYPRIIEKKMLRSF